MVYFSLLNYNTTLSLNFKNYKNNNSNITKQD
jgi:hypothetical protein